jgi:alpha-tubulin suppressor-like RCC1 family protein
LGGAWTIRLVVAAGFAVLAGAAAPGTSGTASATVRATAVVGGVSHTCALTRSGAVKCWGYNGHDELGSGGEFSFSTAPVDVVGLSGIRAISAGVRHSCALTRGGGVKCWGANYGGALGDGTAERRPTPVDVVGLGSSVAAIAAGYDASCALTTAGGVKCWGSNFAGQVGDGTTTDRLTPVDVIGLSSGVSAIASGIHTCALLSAGGVRCWGGYSSGPVTLPGSADVTAIAAGGPTCGLTSDGRVKCWSNGYGAMPVDVPGLSSGVATIASDTGHACALMTGGGVKCWGLNDHGQLGDGTKNDRPTPVGVSGLSTGVRGIGTGAFHSCAVMKSGGIKCWGGGSAGALGDGTQHTRLTPVKVFGFGPTAVVTVVSRSVMVTPARIAGVKLRCGAQARCRGMLTLTRRLGAGGFSIPAGSTRAVRVKLTPRSFRLLVRLRRLPAHVRLRYRQPDGGTTTATRTVTLVAPTYQRR